MVEPAGVPEADFGPAFAWTAVTTFVAVISPPKSRSEATSLVASASAFLAPTSVAALADNEPVLTTDPSVGYEKLPPSATASGGALTGGVPPSG
jgi:hypothetical protein